MKSMASKRVVETPESITMTMDTNFSVQPFVGCSRGSSSPLTNSMFETAVFFGDSGRADVDGDTESAPGF